MLVLTRRRGEGFVIGDDIHVVISRLEGDRVRVAVDAPKDKIVVRDELVRYALTDQGPAADPPPPAKAVAS